MDEFLKWLKAAGIRCIKTIAQTMLASLTVGMAINEVDWINLLSVSLLAGLLSLLTSIVGLPELDNKEEG